MTPIASRLAVQDVADRRLDAFRRVEGAGALDEPTQLALEDAKLPDPLTDIAELGVEEAANVLGAFGVLLFLNRFAWLTSQLQDALSAAGLRRLINLG